MAEDLNALQPTEELADIYEQCDNLSEINQSSEKKSRFKWGRKQSETNGKDEFSELAELMNVSVEQLKDEFFLFQLRKLMSKLAKAIVRVGVSGKELEKLFHNAKELCLDEIVVAPSYIPACSKQVNKMGENGYKVGAVIDFPFGESTLKSKLTCVKDCVSAGVDDITVAMPTMLINKEQIKAFKRQCKKIGKSYKGRAGVAINASDLDEEGLKLALKAINKTKLAFVTLVFGSATVEEVCQKTSVVKKYKENKSIFVLANVDNAKGIMTLFKQDVDKIITPFADEIGLELVKKFKIKCVKLK